MKARVRIHSINGTFPYNEMQYSIDGTLEAHYDSGE